MKAKSFSALIIILSTLSFILQINQSLFAQNASEKYVIVIHGGAGTFPQDSPDSIKNIYLDALSKALTIGKSILEKGGSALDAVEQTIRFMEDDSLFNTGKGAVFTSEGKHELDASIMDGKDLSNGAVAGVTKVKNPISLARIVMEKTPHVLFASEGADELGLKFGVELVSNSYFHTDYKYLQWLKQKEKLVTGETVGCVALDIYGNIAAGTSTGGRNNKWPGRVGDSPIIGAGTYANNQSCGVSATGWGELFIKNVVSFNVSALMLYKNFSLEQACKEMIFNLLPEGSGGLIAIDKNGNYEMVYNTQSMLKGVANSSGLFEVSIWK